LTQEGSKPIEQLDFGFVDIEHSNHAWFMQKLKDPRIFDQGKVKTPDEKLRMPNFHLTQEEAEAITTALLGFVKDKPAPTKIKPRTSENLNIEQGQKIIRQFNCQGCHTIEGEGGAIQPKVAEWLVKFDNRSESEAKALIPSFSPPNLIGEGRKVQPDWLFHFIHEPVTIRPWLKVRMPTYKLNVAHLNALIKYFNDLDNQEFPFASTGELKSSAEEIEAGRKLLSNDYFGCAQCHVIGNKLPAGSQDSWAPDLSLAKTRLKPEWVIDWIKNPSALLPGTKMPTFYDPKNFDTSGPEDILGGDENKQIKALRDYIFSLSTSNGAVPAAKPEAENTASPQQSAVEQEKNLSGPQGSATQAKPETPATQPAPAPSQQPITAPAANPDKKK
jgi:mono/diheme cytochrome c family protein